MDILTVVKLFCVFIFVKIFAKIIDWSLPPIYGHYSQKTSCYTIKKWLMFIFLRLFVKRERLLAPLDPKKNPSFSGYGITPSEEEENVEAANTMVEFLCFDDDGNELIAGVDNQSHSGWLHLNYLGEEFQLPVHPNPAVPTRNINKFEASGLSLQSLQPFRKWKITFNGFLRKVTESSSIEENESVQNGNFKLIWTPSHSELVSGNNHRNDWLLSKAIAREKWTPENIKRFQQSLSAEWYEQWGMLEGKFKLDGENEVHLVLKGKKRSNYRQHIGEKISSVSNCELHKRVTFDIYSKDGTVIHFNSESYKNGLTNLNYGYALFCDTQYEELNDCNFSLPHTAEFRNFPDQLELTFQTNKRCYNAHILISPATHFHLINGAQRNLETFHFPIKASVNGFESNGFLRITYPTATQKGRTVSEVQHLLQAVPTNDRNLLAVTLADMNCTDGDFVGGKAMSLGLMKTIKTNEFTVPNGICLTTKAYWEQMNANSQINKKLQQLESICCSSTLDHTEELQNYCSSLVETISKMEVIPKVKTEILQTLKRTFDAPETKRFAVRSSAIGEDGDEASSAGQNETYLGVQGYDKIFEAVSKCWASQFTFQAVQYRRQHGQLINSGMGVVIQEMVPSSVAGVLFTREPVSGNISKMLVTANYGLGESVVSAKCDPDTIYIQRTWKDDISVLDRNLGTKNMLITMDESGSGTKDLEVTDEQKMVCCLSDDQIVQLGRIGVLLENGFGNPRDVEWAYDKNGHLYILQSRPITNFDKDDDWTLAIELNTVPFSDYDVSTTANTREVMPGALSPLTISTIQHGIDINLKNTRGLGSSYSMRHMTSECLTIYGWSLLVNLTNALSYGVSRELSGRDLGTAHSLLGGNIYENGLHETLLHRYGEMSIANTYKSTLPAIKQMFQGGELYKKRCETALEKAKSRFVFSEEKSATYIYNTIQEDVSQFMDVISAHVEASSASSIFTGVIIAILTANQKDFTEEHLEDLATLLGNCSDLISADVPAAIEKLTTTIASLSTDTKNMIKNSSAEEVLKWLQKDNGPAGISFRDFLKVHGLRGFREMEFRAKTWADDPSTLVNVIQASVKSTNTPKQEKVPLSLFETITNLHTKLPFIARLILLFVLKKSKTAVGVREFMKSNLVQMCAIYRGAYRKLGAKMVSEGRIPNEDLIFYFTQYELGLFLKTRSPALLNKVIQRRLLHPRLENLNFPSLIYGYHKVQLEDEFQDVISSPDLNSDLILRATCASRGKCKGKARVVSSIQEANSIMRGDILITYATDICWTPYFPLLSGIVTEIGGLVSHGAVVAREYGLPCLIAADKATKLFKSGDEVILDASKGTIQLISRTEENNK